ncbi:phenylacetic acid degradation bifunctional protein PaaZ [Lutimaribacter sp. EGI FJ00015]|uniref:Phenylacetic acid degradation bifunctional protein PaaZ n=1 Tax=Lutimaribacter degradans TaxID=2945989 RepID=A0ACC5ZT35_9RHOB|nr:phenylacetic acid degradation bifunctional protein PaaZ [Lutimaribacter sp. EGI FJ00013]MCM2561461.1 phenylacetic acid degradation bifunctional protein PaaZ [Lutimaribacter sp. EGI FJ00013]MCO0612828.1 phenylacetic acid degradation bifunctional protein PaaZ [Lutimaribacter sp. EGI FJ00015]MCO0635486.1 phenylacetic acid degradation bifunctional protein PaaZ [Lutimaribacter sp. EGI FJ00014]
MLTPESFACGQWIAPGAGAQQIIGPVTGTPIARAGDAALDFAAMLEWAKTRGGPALREITFHQRAKMLKALAGYLDSRKEELYALNPMTGATRRDGWVDIDGGIGTMFLFASKGRREMPEGQVYIDGEIEQLSRNGTFLGQHIAVPLQGVAVHINAFNFPVWGMLEKMAPALLAGMPCIVKPATQTCYLTEACFRMIVESGILPEGAVQLIIGRTGDLLDRLGAQDVVAFTGSADTAMKLRGNHNLLRNSVRFTSEQDSLNAAILGPDAAPDSPEFDLFVKEALAEITTKAGQKCTAMRRLIVPRAQLDAVAQALAAKLEDVKIGDPADKATRMGALASLDQKADVQAKLAQLKAEARVICGDTAPDGPGAFLAPTLLACDDPDGAQAVHEIEAFGPVSTLMPYDDTAHAARLANAGGGSLVASLFSHDAGVARDVTLASAAHHGRLYIMNRDSADEATGHGSPLPHMIHGGPGRAGGGEELGGVRGVLHYMQRTAIQGSPDMLSAITGTWVKGSAEKTGPKHPFQRTFREIEIGETIHTDTRTVSLDDIEHFAHFTGDTFYAHMDEAAARANPFFPGRVAHGYLLLSFAAGLFVQPDPGPVLANTGLNGLSFQKPVSPGDSVAVRLTCKRKTGRTDSYGEVAWNATLTNQDGEQVAEYELLTMVAYDRP